MPSPMSTNMEEERCVESLSPPDQMLRVRNFVWSADEWPKLKHDDFNNEEDIPVISLKGKKIGEDYGDNCSKMVAAAQKWGFFKLVDHGVPADAINDITLCLNKFFDLSMEQKLKGAPTGSLPVGYSASNLDYGHNLPWAEILQLLQSPQQVVEISEKVYGDHLHHDFSNAMTKYMNAMEELGMSVLEMLANGLGLASNFFTKEFSERENNIIRANRYPPCPLPNRCLGLGSHSDPHTLTILLQDQVGGLQVRNAEDDLWFGIRPLPDSFVVNIGDTLQAWTNGRLKSVVHRAIVNEERYRLSVAYFMSPSTNTTIESAPELMDPQPNPRKYKTFTWGEFRNELLKQRRVVGKTALHRYTIYP